MIDFKKVEVDTYTDPQRNVLNVRGVISFCTEFAIAQEAIETMGRDQREFFIREMAENTRRAVWAYAYAEVEKKLERLAVLAFRYSAGEGREEIEKAVVEFKDMIQKGKDGKNI